MAPNDTKKPSVHSVFGVFAGSKFVVNPGCESQDTKVLLGKLVAELAPRVPLSRFQYSTTQPASIEP
ncbi:MAG: hypothetical protein C7B46_11315 [Sulfobacillus benefaciens]|uniref:Uncharacterized protein n=1 Tax=Sulfobacillus benefaciens TaxID=453960 RepID=A0A2T2XF82_9FIRM|nr:MAG: hypothetical protein C7B46_11315 [Sulfobacillus benefaciens]